MPVITDNKPGASSNIGTEYVAKSAPDGYTLLFTSSALVLSPALYKNPGYDLVRDFAPVFPVYTSPMMLTAHPSVPAASIQEFVAYAKKNPGKLAFASAGVGNITHLSTQMLFNALGVDALHVPSKSGASAVADLVGGNVQLYSGSPTAVAPLIKDNRIKPLVIMSPKRVQSLPDVPTASETVLPNFEVGTWAGLLMEASMSSTSSLGARLWLAMNCSISTAWS